MTNFTNEQLEAWASLGPWEWNQTGDDDHVENTLISKDAGIVLNASWRPSSCEIQVADPDSEALIAAAPALAAALLAERKAREVEVAKLKAAIQDIAENWKWWDEDRYDRCSSVVGDSIAEAEQALKGGERS